MLDRVGVCAVVSASVGEGEEMLDGLLTEGGCKLLILAWAHRVHSRPIKSDTKEVVAQSRKRVHRRPLNRQQRRKLRNTRFDRTIPVNNRWKPSLMRAIRWVARVWKITQIAETILSLIDLL